MKAERLVAKLMTLGGIEIVLVVAVACIPAFLILVMLGDMGLHGLSRGCGAAAAFVVLTILCGINVAQLKNRKK